MIESIWISGSCRGNGTICSAREVAQAMQGALPPPIELSIAQREALGLYEPSSERAEAAILIAKWANRTDRIILAGSSKHGKQTPGSRR